MSLVAFPNVLRDAVQSWSIVASNRDSDSLIVNIQIVR